MLPVIGLWLVGAILFNCNPRLAEGYSKTNRINWVIEQLAAPPLATPPGSTKFQAAVSAANSSDAVSTQGSVLYDATSLFDFGVKYSNRFFPQLTDEGDDIKAENLGYRESISAQIGRSYVTPENNYGRLSVEYIQFNPLRFKLLRLGFNTGILETPSVPWILRINFHVFFVLKKALYPQYNPPRGDPPVETPTAYQGFDDSKIFSGEAEIGQRVLIGKANSFRLGAMLGWTYRTREIPQSGDNPAALGVHFEHMLFSIGPWMEYGNSTSQLRLSVPWRIWLDKEVFKKKKSDGSLGTFVRYPNEIRLPDVSLAWVLCL